MFILKIDKCVVAIEKNKPNAIKRMKEIIFQEPNIDLITLNTMYPQGAEKQLIKTLLNREVPSGQLPFSVGVLVHNVGTAYAIARAVKSGEPLTSRIVTVSGKGIKTPKNLLVRIGTLLKDIADYCGGITEDLDRVIMGGPMMGIAQSTLDVPVIKGTSGLLFLSKDETISREYVDCFRCGKCSRVCPMKLMPNMLSIYIDKNKLENASAYYPEDCIECGCCAYVCPALRPIVQQIKWAKTQLTKK